MQTIGSLKFEDTKLGEKKGIRLINSSSPWASDLTDLKALYESPFTAAVTTRTAVIESKDIESIQTDSVNAPFQSTFPEDNIVHTHSFLRDALNTLEGGKFLIARGSLNSYGYSPHPLSSYLSWVSELFKSNQMQRKPIIISITGPPNAIEATIVYLRKWIFKQVGDEKGASSFLGVELNLSCPNIKGNDTPSGYDGACIAEYVAAIQKANLAQAEGAPQLTVGLKLPPYTYQAQFKSLGQALSSVPLQPATLHAHPVSFLTSTNTLGCSLWFNDGEDQAKMVKSLPSTSATDEKNSQSYDGTGGLAGESLHPIALGNVFNLNKLLKSSQDERLHAISVIGVGGVMSGLSARRMNSAGATVIGIATALGREGIEVFERISNEILEDLDSESDY